MILSVILAVFMVNNFTSFSTELLSGSKIGAGYSYGFDNHYADLSSISVLETCCPKDLVGSGGSHQIGLNFGFKVSESGFVNLGISYINRNSALSANENILLNFDSVPLNGIFRHDLSLEFQSYLFSISYNQDLIGTFGIESGIDFEFHFKNTIQYSESLTSPEDRGFFPDTGTRKRNFVQGSYSDLKPMNINFHLKFSKEYPLNIDYLWTANPFIGLRYTLSGINSVQNWNLWSIEIGVRITRNKII
ncbi:MAG: hypothetical protein KIT33_00805 [Candidatus Kapabacteria bacterium]|nr:hypothetical protein [Candidatus Kapabacteria bacterium]